jgi:hypothetical protein
LDYSVFYCESPILARIFAGTWFIVRFGDPIMFLRVVRATVSKGVKREYVRVVEAYRDRDGKTRHRTVINLGRKDLLAEHFDFGKLRRLLHGDAAGDDRVAHKDIGAVGAWDWGPLLAARRMWSDLGLDTTPNSRGPIAARRCG